VQGSCIAPPGREKKKRRLEKLLEVSSEKYLIVPLLEAFEWFDSGLQNSLCEIGWPTTTREESMVMIHIILGLTRPSDIARELGLSRQAVHVTVTNMSRKGILELKPDKRDGRAKVVELTAKGKAMRKDAQRISMLMFEQLAKRIGEKNVQRLVHALTQDWGKAPTFDKHGNLIG